MTEVLRVPIVRIGSDVEPESRWVRAPALGAALIAVVLGLAPGTMAAPQDKQAAQDKSAAGPEHLFGEYLAGRHAQQRRDFSGAAKWFEKAIAADPDAPEVISRSFLMEVSVGYFDRALALAPKELKLDPSDAIVQMVLLIDRLKAGDNPGASKYAAALPSDGVHRFIRPFAL